MTFEEELTLLSAKCKNYIRTGRISMYSAALKEIADLFYRNDRIKDQLKALVISFYIDLSGFGCAPIIDRHTVEQLRTSLHCNCIDEVELERLYFEWIQPDMIMQHTLGVKDSWYLLRLCAQGKTDQADYILSKI